MTKSTLLKIGFTLLAAAAAGTLPLVPAHWAPVVSAVAAAILGAVHVPRPGDAKAVS